VRFGAAQVGKVSRKEPSFDVPVVLGSNAVIPAYVERRRNSLLTCFTYGLKGAYVRMYCAP
jgi:hypothetical protein